MTWIIALIIIVWLICRHISEWRANRRKAHTASKDIYLDRKMFDALERKWEDDLK